MKISIIGAGSFGTAMAAVAASCGNDILLWAHDPNVAAEIEQTRRNPIYLQSVALDGRVRATSSLAEAAEFSDVLFMIVPSHHYRGVLVQIQEHLRGEVAIVSGTKGIENDTLQRMSEVTAIRECPRTSITTRSGTPCTSSRLAALCRRSWNRIRGSPASRSSRWSCFVTVEP